MWGVMGWLPLPLYLIWRCVCALHVLSWMDKTVFGILTSNRYITSPIVTCTLQWLLFEAAAYHFHLVNIFEATDEQALMTFFFAWATTAVVLCAPIINRGRFCLQPVYCNHKTRLPLAAATYVVLMFMAEIGLVLFGKLLVYFL